MYSTPPYAIDNATIDPANLSSPNLNQSAPRGVKRNRSPGVLATGPGDDGSAQPQHKRGKLVKPRVSGPPPDTTNQAHGSAMPPTIPPSQTPQSHNAPIPAQPPGNYSTQAPMPPKTTPTKSTLKALPTVRDHTTDQLNQTGDEYIPREIDEFGEKKVEANGHLCGGRVYRCRTFLVPNRGEKLFMLATECARVLGYRDSYLLFNKNRSLYKIIASQTEKDDLVHQEILPFSYRSRQIAIVTARSMFRQFGSRVIDGGRRVRDDYWEAKARKQGFTEADPAGEKRPGASRAKEAAEAAQNNNFMGAPHTEIVYNQHPGPYPGAPQPNIVQPGMMGAPLATAPRMPALTVAPELTDNRSRDYGGIVKGGPRQEITGPPYQDQTRPSALGEIHSQAHHAADYSRNVNQQRDMRGDYIQNIWRRPHEQPASSSLSQPLGSNDTSLPNASRPAHPPHTSASGLSQTPVVSSQSPQMIMTAAPYSQTIHAQSTLGQAPMRSGSMSQSTPSYNYQSAPSMWSQSPQTPQHQYNSYTTQGQPPHPSQSPASHLRQPSSGQMQPNMQFSNMGGMQYGAGQGMYPADQTSRQYMSQSTPSNPNTSQAWSGQHSPPPQWWTPQQQ